MTKEIANFFWEGKLTKLEKSCIKSFVNNGFEVKLWSYNNLQVDGAESCDANQVLNRDAVNNFHHDDHSGKTEKQSSLAAFSDIFRIAAINKTNGGWWFDADCFCLKSSSEFKVLRAHHNICAGIQYGSLITNGVIYMSKDYSDIYFNQLLNYTISAKNKKWGVFGPEFLTSFINQFNLKDGVFSKELFYEIGWEEFDHFVDPKLCKEAEERIKDSYVCHIFTTSFNTRNLDKDSYYPEGCLLDKFYKKASN